MELGEWQMILTFPLDPYPNQTVSAVINNSRWAVQLLTRLGRLYATVGNDEDGVIVRNRVCLDRIFITRNLVFVDQAGSQDPEYSGLGNRYQLVWTDES